MAENYRGLNVNVYLADIDDKETSLGNLGIDIDDLEGIRGINADGVSSLDLRTISGLDVDQKKELYAMSRTSATIGNLLRDMKDIARPLEFNMAIDDQVRAGAIKYNFIDWSAPTTTKSADISTSRVSSWSSSDSPASPTSDIFYGGEVKVVGNTVEAANVQVQEAPTLARYPAEAPTHTITIDVNGQAKEFHAMKGIPLTFNGFFRNANLRGKVNQQGSIIPTWTVRNEDDNRFYETYTPSDENNPRAGGSSIIQANTTWYFRDSLAHPRELNFYYNPSYIQEFDLNGLNLTELPNVSLPALTSYNLTFNDFYEVPRFDQIAPALTNINMTGNNLSRIGVSAQTQLQRFPNTIQTITMNGCFQEGVDIDISNYTNLRTLNLNSYYSSYGRRYLSGTVSPKVNSSSIQSYNISHQGYSRLSKSVMDAPDLVTININANNISAAREDGTSNDSDIEFASNNLTNFYSYSNNHNIVPANNDPGPINSIRDYRHTYSSPTGTGQANSRSVTGKFNGATNLGYLNLYGTSATGNIGSDFSNLPSLYHLELRRTSLSGTLNDNTFANTQALQRFRIEYAGYNSSNFFNATFDGDGNLVTRGGVFRNTPDLRDCYIYHNKNIAGPLPDYSKCKQLRVLYIYYTNVNGVLPNFSSNPRLYYIRCSHSAFTGSAPSFNGNQFYYLYLENNNFSGPVPLQQGSNIRRLYLHYNSGINGALPTFANTPRMQYLYLYNCSISQYNLGTLDTNTWLRRFDISNNRLNVSSVRSVIFDAVENYKNNPRRGVTINCLGQLDLSGNAVTEAAVAADEATEEAIAFLRAVGWTILI